MKKEQYFKAWKDKNIAILGMGIEGIAVLTYLSSYGIAVSVHDKKAYEELSTEAQTLLKKTHTCLVTGDRYLEGLDSYDVIIRSPGFSILLPQLQSAKAKGIIITSQTQIFLDLCPAFIIGVTGTKGKGTTTTLIAEMLKKEGKKVCIGGNIGRPPLSFLDTLDSHSYVVLELSSFQLQDITKSPHIAVMLMITSEHLDYHADVLEYIDAKRNIIRFQTVEDTAIINRDYPASNESDIYTDGKVWYVSRERVCENGCSVKGNSIVLQKQGKEQFSIDVKSILLPGQHNYENVCAASLAAFLAGASKESIKEVLQSFKGLEHRLELVRTVNNISYYNDSFATTPESTIAAIKAFDKPEILILGGSTKQADFSELGKVICAQKNIRAIIGIGVEWPRIQEHLSDLSLQVPIIEGCRSMKEIIAAVQEVVHKGDVVLLSPACASFDMFADYKDRGDQFKKEVASLPEK